MGRRISGLVLGAMLAAAGVDGASASTDFPELPLPPAIAPPTSAAIVPGVMEAPTRPPVLNPRGRALYLERITREAERHGLPPAVADAVATVESAYNPNAVGGVGEVGLMQVLPTTATMLGHRGPVTALFDPEVNIRYGVMYLAQAWRLTGGNLCETLMKYRAGHGETRMSALSVSYCLRARTHLASIESPLANAPVPPAVAIAGPPPRSISARQGPRVAGARVAGGKAARAKIAMRRTRWAAQDAKVRAIESRVSNSMLAIMR
ncbi:lytic transglycosylase domain-containing protein [Salinarimonas soli]|uniref:Transglycosylase SLT domain-containing protein n=1 Tax=Salinarimonas soli TaxID=1638099 RepID=A0A5B2VFR6_9HYPH|nr:transglycosylase SLT domain-containing protein [Salinarimonas soli]KAA2237310.1 transglycosylase SLT domain-containing protein [Salinarimonas soli]